MGLEQHSVRKWCSPLRGGREDEHARHKEGSEDKGVGLRLFVVSPEDIVVGCFAVGERNDGHLKQ